MDSTYGGEGASEVRGQGGQVLEWREVGVKTGLVIQIIWFWIQTPQIRLELRIKMKTSKTQIVRTGAKSQPVNRVSGARGQERKGWGQGEGSSQR